MNHIFFIGFLHFSNGFLSSFIFVLNITVDQNTFYCGEISHGFRLAMHLPNELPQLHSNNIFIRTGQSLIFSVKPRVIKTSEGLRSYSPQARGCYFQAERKLRFFRSYSQAKCQQECLVNFTHTNCGCVLYSMPSK